MCGSNRTVHAKDGTEIDFMCLTMKDQASCWFEIVELSVITEAIIPPDTKGPKGTMTHKQPKLSYFDKLSAMISNLVSKTWFSGYPHCQYINYDNGSEFKLHFEALIESCQEPTSKCYTGAGASGDFIYAPHC